MLLQYLAEEGWRGKNSPPNSQSGQNRRSKHSILNTAVQRTIKVPLMRNGSRQFYNKNCTVLLTETCSFDVVFQIFAAFSIDYSFMKNYVKNNQYSDFCSMITSAFESGSDAQIMNKLLKKRDSIMTHIHASKIGKSQSGLISINCKSNVSYIMEHVFPSNLVTYRRTKKCGTCMHSIINDRVFIDINIDTFADKNISIDCLSDHINNELLFEGKKSKCIIKSCNGVLGSKTKLSRLVMIDLQLRYPETNKKFSINEAPSELKILDNNYKLVAMIEYISGSDVYCDKMANIDEQSDGSHYIAYIRRFNNQWEKYDDTLKTIESPDCDRQAEIHILFYIRDNET